MATRDPTDESCEELEDPVRSPLFGQSLSGSACRVCFLGLPGAPLSLNLQVKDKLRQREQPLFSPEHRSFRAPIHLLEGGLVTARQKG